MATLRLLIPGPVQPGGPIRIPSPIQPPPRGPIGSGGIAGLPQPPSPGAQPKLVLAAAGVVCTLPLGPTDSTHGGMGWDWQATDRAGRKGLVTAGGQKLRTLEFPGLVVGYASHQQSIDAVLILLERIANLKSRVAISYSRPERGVWVLTGLSFNVTARQAGSNTPTRATVDLTFLEYVPLTPVIGPARPKAVSVTAPARPKPATTSSGVVSAVGRYTTVGDNQTLWSIAARFYGNGALWPRIADANGIRDPKKLTAGTRLRIP